MSDAYVTVLGIGIQTILYLLGAYALYVRNEAKQRTNTEHLSAEVEDMKIELSKLALVITTQAVQTTRLDNLLSQMTSIERRVEDMRRGAGYVKSRRELDGEYEG